MFKMNEFLKVKEAASFLGVTPNTLRRWGKEHRITLYRIPHNKYRLYKKSDLEEFLSRITEV